jgi:hypothetical protein
MVFASRSSTHALLMDSIARLMDLPLFNKEPRTHELFRVLREVVLLTSSFVERFELVTATKVEYAFMIIIMYHISTARDSTDLSISFNGDQRLSTSLSILKF